MAAKKKTPTAKGREAKARRLKDLPGKAQEVPSAAQVRGGGGKIKPELYVEGVKLSYSNSNSG